MPPSHDLAGRRTRLTHRDGFYVAYAYDDLGRRVSLTRGNGTVTSYGYDAVSRLDELTRLPRPRPSPKL